MQLIRTEKWKQITVYDKKLDTKQMRPKLEKEVQSIRQKPSSNMLFSSILTNLTKSLKINIELTKL